MSEIQYRNRDALARENIELQSTITRLQEELASERAGSPTKGKGMSNDKRFEVLRNPDAFELSRGEANALLASIQAENTRLTEERDAARHNDIMTGWELAKAREALERIASSPWVEAREIARNALTSLDSQET